MNRKTQLAAVGTALAVSILSFVRCGAEGEIENVDAANETTQNSAATEAEAFVENAVEQVQPVVYAEPEPVRLVTKVGGMVIDGPNLYAVFEGGIVVYNFSDKSRTVVGVDDKLTSVALHDGVVYVGGQNLYQFDGTSLGRLDNPAEGYITCLYGYGDQLMVGTAQGLYSWCGAVSDLLFDDVIVSSLVADESGLWVGTMGQGLYRWDGEEFRKRYLLRDPHMFDTVNALDYNHRHLYVGTTNGLHVHDGGRWEVLTTVEGLPSNNVSAIDASAWVVYVGTGEGVVSFFGGDLRPVNKLADTKVNVIRLKGRQVIAATDYEGILGSANNTLKVLVPSVLDTTMDILSLMP